jgi:hypothetical protein
MNDTTDTHNTRISREMLLSPAYAENLLANLMDADDVTTAHGIRAIKISTGYDLPFTVRFVVPMSLGDSYVNFDYDILAFAYGIVSTMFSETTNDDACDVTIRERSAHFDLHEDLKELHDLPFATVVILDVSIVDALS